MQSLSTGLLRLPSQPPLLLPHQSVPSRQSWGEAQITWVNACAARLRELQPAEDEEMLSALAADLWADVGGFDPMIAAEMESESRHWPE